MVIKTTILSVSLLHNPYFRMKPSLHDVAILLSFVVHVYVFEFSTSLHSRQQRKRLKRFSGSQYPP